MKCECCGKEMESNERFCPNCGANNENYVEPVKAEVVEGNQSQTPSTNVYQQNTKIVYVQQNSQKESSALGVCAIIFSILGGWLGLILAIVGLSTYKEPDNRRNCKIALGILGFWIFLIFILALARA